jgi:protein-S-isoprenylcysteine O-methyltransferase Ste14
VKLAAKAWLSLAVLTVVMALLVFVPAGDVRGYPEASFYLCIYFAASAWTTCELIDRDPALLERRIRGGPTAEPRPRQRTIVLITSLAFIALLVVPALDHRFAWSSVPTFLVVAGDVLVAIGCYGILRVYRVNSYTSATVDVASGQTLVSTGPYATVRHPMYACGLLYVVGTPLALRSWWGLAPVAVMLPALIWRLIDEERLLARELAGYTDYQLRVRYRLIPRLW